MILAKFCWSGLDKGPSFDRKVFRLLVVFRNENRGSPKSYLHKKLGGAKHSKKLGKQGKNRTPKNTPDDASKLRKHRARKHNRNIRNSRKKFGGARSKFGVCSG